MMKTTQIKTLALGLFVLIITACSSTSGPVAIRDVSTPPAKAETTDTKQQVALQPVAPDKAPTVIPLVEKLITQSTQALNKKEYEQSIDLAEKGLRINRKEPRLYLLLAKAYRGQKNTKQSAYFAKQGLRYANKTDASYAELSRLAN